MKEKFVSLHLDFIGFSASLLCAVHCVALPFTLSLTSLAGLKALGNPWTEYTIIIFSFIIASCSLLLGYLRHHHRKTPLVVVIFGFLLVTLGHMQNSELQEMIFTSLGAVAIAVAHVLNWKYMRSSKAQYPDCLSKKAINEKH